MLAATIAETPRLRIREFTTDDTAFIVELLNSPGFLRYIGDRGVRTREDALRYLEQGALESYRVNGFGTFMVEVKASDEPVGMCGLVRKDWLERPDLAYAFLPQAEGLGYAAEAARAIVEFTRNNLQLDYLLAVVLPDHSRSIRVLDKLGFAPDGTVVDPRNGSELLRFRLRLPHERADGTAGSVRIIRDGLYDPRAIALLETHVQRARAETARGSAHALDLARLRAADVMFWSAWIDDTAAGVGALRLLSADQGEVKSMYTADECRGRGVASALLKTIIAAARARGLQRLSLETGSWSYFDAARQLYAKHGFVECAPFGDYHEDPNSVFMTLSLA